MYKSHDGCCALRRLALAGLVLGASVITGPGAFGQTSNPSGVQAPPSPAVEASTDQAAAGVAVPGRSAASSDADTAEQSEAAAASPPEGPVHPSGVVGAAPRVSAPTRSEQNAAGVKVQ